MALMVAHSGPNPPHFLRVMVGLNQQQPQQLQPRDTIPTPQTGLINPASSVTTPSPNTIPSCHHHPKGLQNPQRPRMQNPALQHHPITTIAMASAIPKPNVSPQKSLSLSAITMAMRFCSHQVLWQGTSYEIRKARTLGHYNHSTHHYNPSHLPSQQIPPPPPLLPQPLP